MQQVQHDPKLPVKVTTADFTGFGYAVLEPKNGANVLINIKIDHYIL